MNIGIFGDSFCSIKEVEGFLVYSTYIKKIEKHYDANIVNLGVNGSSIYDVILLQFPETLEKFGYPDVCIFVWTSQHRIFHRKIRTLNLGTVFNLPPKDPDIWDAAKKYYNHLMDNELHELQYKSVLSYFDNEVLSKFPKTTKIIHLWSFETYKICSYRWKNGVEITPSMSYIADYGKDNPLSMSVFDNALNHFSGEDKNNTIFSWIKDAIDNYEEKIK